MSYFTTSFGFVVEAFRNGVMVADFRHTDRSAERDKLREMAAEKAYSIAKDHGIPARNVVYDLDGERDEESLFG